jgi:hypothetical protein
MRIQLTTPAKTLLARTLSVAIAVAVAASAFACSVPVFRYAIEHWRPDAYRVFVYHDQDLADQDRALLSKIKAEIQKGANVQVQTIDLRSSTEPIDKARWDLHSDRPLPQMVVQLPSAIGGGEAPVAVADWNETEVANLLSSPKRAEIAQRLVDGEVVWVFLESDNQESNDALFQVLHEQLAIQQETLELPEIDDADLKDLSADPESLEIRFSTIRVSRTDAAEKWFVEMLLSIEPDLRDAELVDQAMVFPVFGRGRALYALVGDGINADMIRDAATFLTGACQCTVKAENPGVDLLIPMPWDQLIKVSEPLEVSLPLVGLGGGLPMVGGDVEKPGKLDGTPVDGVEETAVTVGQNEPTTTSPQRDQASFANAAELASLEQQSSGLGLWLPILLVLAIGSVAGLLGAFVMRR